jgi:hypothetical protein
MIIGLPQAMFEHSAHLVCSYGLSMPPQAKEKIYNIQMNRGN